MYQLIYFYLGICVFSSPIRIQMETEVGSHQVTALVRILSSAVQYVVTRFSVSGDG